MGRSRPSGLTSRKSGTPMSEDRSRTRRASGRSRIQADSHRASAEDRGADQFHPGLAELAECILRGRAGYAGSHTQQDSCRQAGIERVESRSPDAMIGGDTHNVNGANVVSSQPIGQAGAVMVLALEAGVGGGVLSFVENRVERLRVEVGMESGAVSADDAMRRPAIDEVREIGRAHV